MPVKWSLACSCAATGSRTSSSPKNVSTRAVTRRLLVTSNRACIFLSSDSTRTLRHKSWQRESAYYLEPCFLCPLFKNQSPLVTNQGVRPCMYHLNKVAIVSRSKLFGEKEPRGFGQDVPISVCFGSLQSALWSLIQFH